MSSSSSSSHPKSLNRRRERKPRKESECKNHESFKLKLKLSQAATESDADLQRRWFEAADEYPSTLRPPCPSCEQTPPSHHHPPPPRPPTISRAWAGELDRHPIFTTTSAALSSPPSALPHHTAPHTSRASLTARFAPTPPSPLHPTRVLCRARARSHSHHGARVRRRQPADAQGILGL